MQNRIALTSIAFLLVWLTSAATAQEFGMASFYSDEFQGSTTAYGFTYNKDDLTCAHKKHPPGTILRVTRLDNKKSIDVKVIDQGPFIKGRIVDLSRRAAERIDLVKDGVARVKVEVLKVGQAGGKEKVAESKPPVTKEDERVVPPPYDQTIPEKKQLAEKPEDKATPTPKPAAPSKEPPKAQVRSTTPATPNRSRLAGKEFQDFGLYQIQILNTEKAGFAVQVASLTQYPNVFRQVADLQAKGFDNVLISIEKGELIEPVYKVILGTFDSEESAQRYRQDLQRRYKIKGFVVNLTEIAY